MSINTLDLISKCREYLDYIENHIKKVQEAYAAFTAITDFSANPQLKDELDRRIPMHDLSKLSAEEFAAYRNYFYPVSGEHKDEFTFQAAWMHHCEANRHHPEDRSLMSDADMVEMACDLVAMSLVKGGSPVQYFDNLAVKRVANERNRQYIRAVLEKIWSVFENNNNEEA